MEPPLRVRREEGAAGILQVWFSGVHSDVGGGYPEAESGRVKISLIWMIEAARRPG